MEWVVETGSSIYVAAYSQVAAATMAHSMPYMYTSGWEAKAEGRATPPETVLVTTLPRDTAPPNSNIAAICVREQGKPVILPSNDSKYL